jgi:hypothetical protein
MLYDTFSTAFEERGIRKHRNTKYIEKIAAIIDACKKAVKRINNTGQGILSGKDFDAGIPHHSKYFDNLDKIHGTRYIKTSILTTMEREI